MKLESVLRYRWIILATYITILTCAIAGTSRLGVNPNNRAFFGPDDPQFSELVEFESEFGTNTSLLFGVHSATSAFENGIFVEAVNWLTERAWSVEGVSRVDSLVTYPFGKYSSDSIHLSTLAEEFCATTCDREAAEKILQPHIINRFISSDARTLAVIASVELDAEDSVSVTRINDEARRLIDEFGAQFPSLEISVTGAVPMMQAFIDASNHDLGSLIVAAVLLFVALLWLFLRGIYLTITLLLLGVSSIVITLGIAGWVGHIVNTATATTPLVIFTLVVAGSMHLFLYVARDVCLSREEVLAAIDRALAANAVPIVLAAATSIVGLLSLVFVSAPPIKQLGILSALGVVVGTGLLLFVVPCVLAWMNRVNPSPALLVVQNLLNRQARRIEMKEEKPWLFGLVFLVLVLFLPAMQVDEDFVRYFGPDNEFRRNSETMTERLSGPYHAEVVVDTGELGGIYQQRVIGVVEKLEVFVRDHPKVTNVLSMNDVLKEVAKSLTGSSSINNLDPDALAQFFLSFELALAKGQSTTDFVDVDHRRARLSVLFGDVSMADIRSFKERVDNWAATTLPDDLRILVTGEGLPTAYLSSNSIQQLSIGIFVSLLFSSCLLGLVYKDVSVVGVILLATATPVLAGFGVWALAVGEIGMAATLVVAVTIGVVIDDSIHLLYRYRDGTIKLDLTAAEAAGYSVHRTAAAIVTTSVVLAGGFSILMLSDFRMNSAFGICSALVITLALVYNTTLMPRALTWVNDSA